MAQCTLFPKSIYEPRHEKTCFMLYSNSKDADQPAHLRSLISIFIVRYWDSMIHNTCCIKNFKTRSVIPGRKPRKQVFSWRSSYILFSETPDCKIYFTANGTRPSPFQRKIGGREITFRYIEPFTLKDGKRTLKAIAVSRFVVLRVLEIWASSRENLSLGFPTRVDTNRPA